MTSPASSRARSTARMRRAAGWVTASGLAVLAGAAVVAESWRPELPDPVAVHWGLNGPNGFSSLNTAVVALIGPGVVLVTAFGAVMLLLGQSAVTRRIAAAATIWLALFLSLLVLGTLNIQRGLPDAHDAGNIDAVLGVAIVASLLAAIVAAALVPGDPRQPATGPVAADAPRVALGEGERSTWMARTDSGPVLGIGLTAVTLVLAVVLVTRIWVMLIVVGLLAVVLMAMCAFVVRIDSTGLTVRSFLGWPTIRVPLDEVIRADVIDVHPLRDFGGWGLRVGRYGRVGVVVRRGEALLVERTGNRSVVVTVDGARTGAGFLNALADRARGRA